MVTADVESVSTRFEAVHRCLVTERCRAVDERDAFRAFETRLRQLHAETPASGGTVPATVQRLAGRMPAVRDAYEATVMAVPHYTDLYDEPYARNVERELGAEVATILTERQVLDCPDRHTLFRATREARRERARLVGALDVVIASLSGSTVQLPPTEPAPGIWPAGSAVLSLSTRRAETPGRNGQHSEDV